MHVTARSQVHSDAISTPYGDHGIGDLQHQTGAIFNRTAIHVRAVIGLVVKKLIEQVAVGSVNFNAVKTGNPARFPRPCGKPR